MSVRDEGVARGEGARGRPNKYLTKSSGKLIPSFGRLLRGATAGGLQPQPAVDALERIRRTVPFRDFPRAISRTDREESRPHAENTGNVLPEPSLQRLSIISRN